MKRLLVAMNRHLIIKTRIKNYELIVNLMFMGIRKINLYIE